ncbi:hypothetical protein VCHA38O209_320010 [Vibrio chagasii]|nr:hypothetical protein VCHA36P166_180068 [Vibrio chagasii]CAH7064862.1 hypothetical protein VCHA40P238_10321 [Vibrio chagasii]CAH7441433.1 hypothetical protein VCHA38O209_320010 [Vibrio chagasii]
MNIAGWISFPSNINLKLNLELPTFSIESYIEAAKLLNFSGVTCDVENESEGLIPIFNSSMELNIS